MCSPAKKQSLCNYIKKKLIAALIKKKTITVSFKFRLTAKQLQGVSMTLIIQVFFFGDANNSKLVLRLE